MAKKKDLKKADRPILQPQNNPVVNASGQVHPPIDISEYADNFHGGSPDVQDALYVQRIFLSYADKPVTNDVELAQRIDEYFILCEKFAQLPQVMFIGVFCGIGRDRFMDFINGSDRFGKDTRKIACLARDRIHSLEAMLATFGVGDRSAYIFNAKNFYGMKDEQSVEVTHKESIADTESREEISKRYADIEDEDVIDAEFTEVKEDGGE